MDEEKEAGKGLPEEEFSDLMAGISRAAPLIKSIAPLLGGNAEGRGERHGERERLLLAMKPFLSPARCEAIDYLLRISHVSEVLRALR